MFFQRKYANSPLWLWLILFICLLILAYVLIVYKRPSLEKLSVGEDFNYILNNVNNGDLILWAGDSFTEKTIQFWHNSYYSHVSFVFIDEDGALDNTKDNTVFVWEADIGQRYKKGPRVMRLSEKLNRWKGYKIAGWRKWKGSPPSKESIHQIIYNYLGNNIQMDRSMLCWIFSDYPQSYIFRYLKGENVTYCSELVADTLQKLNMMEKNHHPAWYTPEWFSKNENYESIVHFSLPK